MAYVPRESGGLPAKSSRVPCGYTRLSFSGGHSFTRDAATRFSAFPVIAERGESPPTSSATSPPVRGLKRTTYLEIWPKNNGPTEVIRGKIREDQILSWLEERDEFVNESNEASKTGALRLLYGPADRRTRGSCDATLQKVVAHLQLPAAFTQMLAPDQIEPPRFSHNTLFDTHGNHLGMVLAELMLDNHRTQLDLTTSRLRNLESAIGVHDHDFQSSSSPSYTPPDKSPLPDFPFISRSLNGESTRLALCEVKVRSNIHLLQTLLRAPYFTAILPINRRLIWMEQANIALREKCEFLLGWNVELSSRVTGQRRIVKILLGSVHNLLMQRESKITTSAILARKGDANAIKSIAILLLAFLPGAYIAVLFSGSMFNWQAKHVGGVLSEWFWLYWAITGPLTVGVLGTWILWSRPWL
ncbi:hypothetical protein NHQ30_008762 [Ciborinia camelliae]|nr:hypothetical protein NHQ30_008762 [Ciborinia camelliae]